MPLEVSGEIVEISQTEVTMFSIPVMSLVMFLGLLACAVFVQVMAYRRDKQMLPALASWLFLMAGGLIGAYVTAGEVVDTSWGLLSLKPGKIYDVASPAVKSKDAKSSSFLLKSGEGKVVIIRVPALPAQRFIVSEDGQLIAMPTTVVPAPTQ